MSFQLIWNCAYLHDDSLTEVVDLMDLDNGEVDLDRRESGWMDTDYRDNNEIKKKSFYFIKSLYSG